MEKYDLLQQIGDGTFGSVLKAVHKKTGQLVAVKRMKQKYFTWEECVNLPEVQILRKLHAHPNIIKLREVVRENNELFFVFEFMDGDMLGIIRKAKQLAAGSTGVIPTTAPCLPYFKIKAYMFQLLQSLAHLHKSGYFHRDLKPENLLVKKEPNCSQEVVKLADFGLVKEIRGRPPFTDYVSTRWYRGPELLLQDRMYNSPVDIWASGCIFVEMITTKPLFPGTNEVDQLFKIMSVFGTPNESVWPEGMALARKIRYAFPSIAPTPLVRLLPSHVPPQALDLIAKMLVYDPKKRITASQALQHPFFTVGLDEEQLTLPPVAVGRPVGGTQSAPNTQLGSQPVQWQGQRPGSGSRPLFPPVEISRPPPITQQPTQPSERDVSKYHLVPVNNSPQTHTTSNNAASSYMPSNNNPTYNSGSTYNNNVSSTYNSNTNAPPSAAYNAVPSKYIPPVQGPVVGLNHHHRTPADEAAVRPITKIDNGGLSPTSTMPKGSALPPVGSSTVAAASTQQVAKKKKQSDIDLDMLMDEFASEMSALDEPKKTVLAPLQEGSSPARNPVGATMQKPPRGSSPLSKPPFSSIPAAAATNATTDLSPLQKLLNSTRYRSGSGSQALPPPAGASSPYAPINTRYGDDDAASSFASSYGLGKEGLPVKRTSNAVAVSPSVNSLLSKKQTVSAPVVDDVPQWLKMANNANANNAGNGGFGQPGRRQSDSLTTVKTQLVPVKNDSY